MRVFRRSQLNGALEEWRSDSHNLSCGEAYATMTRRAFERSKEDNFWIGFLLNARTLFFQLKNKKIVFLSSAAE